MPGRRDPVINVDQLARAAAPDTVQVAGDERIVFSEHARVDEQTQLGDESPRLVVNATEPLRMLSFFRLPKNDSASIAPQR
jgi:hypothetical protein